MNMDITDIHYLVTATDPKPIKGPKNRQLPRKSVGYFLILEEAHEAMEQYRKKGYQSVRIDSFLPYVQGRFA